MPEGDKASSLFDRSYLPNYLLHRYRSVAHHGQALSSFLLSLLPTLQDISTPANYLYPLSTFLIAFANAIACSNSDGGRKASTATTPLGQVSR